MGRVEVSGEGGGEWRGWRWEWRGWRWLECSNEGESGWTGREEG